MLFDNRHRDRSQQSPDAERAQDEPVTDRIQAETPFGDRGEQRPQPAVRGYEDHCPEEDASRGPGEAHVPTARSDGLAQALDDPVRTTQRANPQRVQKGDGVTDRGEDEPCTDAPHDDCGAGDRRPDRSSNIRPDRREGGSLDHILARHHLGLHRTGCRHVDRRPGTEQEHRCEDHPGLCQVSQHNHRQRQCGQHGRTVGAAQDESTIQRVGPGAGRQGDDRGR